MEINIGDIIGGFFDDSVRGFIIGKVVAIGKQKYLVCGMRGWSTHSGDWWIDSKNIILYLKNIQ